MTQLSERRNVRQALEGLALFQDVFDDPIGRAVRGLVAEPTYNSAARLVALLAEEAELYPEQMVGDAWQNHLLDRVLASQNAFSRKAERDGPSSIGEGLRRQVLRELRMLQDIYSQGGKALALEAYSVLGDNSGAAWSDFQPLGRGPALHRAEAVAFKQTLSTSSDWPGLIDQLATIYATVGTGDFARYRAFRWVRDGAKSRLQGVAYPDPIRLENLFGYERERDPIIRNAERFAAGLPGNNALIYGERGTGKSSTVKALLNAFEDRGLRMIEMAKEDLGDFPEIADIVRERRERFVVFVDDLSFDEHETYYKALKVALEGSIEARPENLVFYATSNRRHLVQEHFSDRQSDDGDVHSFESWDEKLSLSDRFGIRVWFGAPDQDRFLQIVDGIAGRQPNLRLSHDELQRRALLWAEQNNGRSGRTARQFMDALVGELALP
ncbi:MAG TPA: ATP-binding protein [Chloroflexota bacterium]